MVRAGLCVGAGMCGGTGLWGGGQGCGAGLCLFLSTTSEDDIKTCNKISSMAIARGTVHPWDEHISANELRVRN